MRKTGHTKKDKAGDGDRRFPKRKLKDTDEGNITWLGEGFYGLMSTKFMKPRSQSSLCVDKQKFDYSQSLCNLTELEQFFREWVRMLNIDMKMKNAYSSSCRN